MYIFNSTDTVHVQGSKNRIDGVMVSILPSGAVDRGFKLWAGLTKDYTIDIIV
jgi:hypothetical protein